MICENLGIFALFTTFISVIVYHVLTQLTILFFKLTQEIVGKGLEKGYFTRKIGYCVFCKIFMVGFVVRIIKMKS